MFKCEILFMTKSILYLRIGSKHIVFISKQIFLFDLAFLGVASNDLFQTHQMHSRSGILHLMAISVAFCPFAYGQLQHIHEQNFQKFKLLNIMFFCIIKINNILTKTEDLQHFVYQLCTYHLFGLQKFLQPTYLFISIH